MVALAISLGISVFDFIPMITANLSESIRGVLQVIVITSGGIFLRYFLSFKYHS
jgi:hypothetical protein